MKKRIKINGFIIFICVVALIFFPKAFLRLTTGPADNLSGVLGMVFLLLGLLLRVSSRGFKSEYSTSGNSLVVGGPYALVRNPMYLGILCIALGIIMLLFQWWTLIAFIIFFTARYITLIRTEEKILAERFGQQYRDYQKNVPRILPRLSMLLSREFLKYLPMKSAWIKKELNSILIVVPGVLAVDLYKRIVLSDNPSAFPYFLFLSGIICIFVVFLVFLAKNYEGIQKEN